MGQGCFLAATNKRNSRTDSRIEVPNNPRRLVVLRSAKALFLVEKDDDAMHACMLRMLRAVSKWQACRCVPREKVYKSIRVYL